MRLGFSPPTTMKVGIAPTLFQEVKSQETTFLLTPLVPQAAIVHIDVSHKRVHRNSINSANIHRALRHPPNLIRTAVLYGIQHSSDYKLQYTTPTIHTSIITRSISQSVFSISRAIPDITAKIIIVIIIAAHNFIRSITLYRLRNKPISLCFRIVIVQAFSPELLVGCILCFFLTGCQMFHKSFCQAMLLCCAFCKFLHLKVLSEIVAILKFSFLGFIAFQSINMTCLVLSFTSYPIND